MKQFTRGIMLKYFTRAHELNCEIVAVTSEKTYYGRVVEIDYSARLAIIFDFALEDEVSIIIDDTLDFFSLA